MATYLLQVVCNRWVRPHVECLLVFRGTHWGITVVMAPKPRDFNTLQQPMDTIMPHSNVRCNDQLSLTGSSNNTVLIGHLGSWSPGLL